MEALTVEPPNARLQLLPKAVATQERRLEAVSCKALLGPDLSHRLALARRCPCQRSYGETVPDTFAESYLITLSAWYSTEGGMVRPICCAVCTLITSSNFIGCSTGSSAGLVPCRILCTYVAARRHMSGKCAA